MAAKTTKQQRAEARKAQAEVLQASIVTRVEELRSSEAWVDYLTFISKFHSYSLRNLLLISAQLPYATQVAGFRRWQELGRQVRKGEKSLKIFGFRERKAREDEDDTNSDPDKPARLVRYFPILSVFDISQTDLIDGFEDPQLAKQLRGDDHAGLYERVCQWIRAQGWKIERRNAQGANGFTSFDSKEIVIAKHLAPAQATKTLIHEVAHALLHAGIDDYETHRGIYETEAESVAFVVAGAFNVDTSDYSIGYVAGWSAFDPDVIEETAARVLKCAHQIIEALTDAETEEEEVAA